MNNNTQKANSLRYFFQPITECEMCGESTSSHKVMGQRLNSSQGFRPRKKTGIAVTVQKCNNCKLIYSNPQPIPFDIQDHYGIPPEEYWKPEYFVWNPSYFSYEIKVLNELKPISKGMRALDVGAGLGKCMLSLKHAGFDAYGFEPSKPFYERAITKMNIPPDKIKLSAMEDAEYEDNFFDFITFGAVFEHLYHPAECLRKAMQWLKPGGIVQIEVPSSSHLISKFYNIYFKLWGTNYVTNISPMTRPFHLYEFSLKSFQELAKKLNYKILRHEYYLGDIYFIPGVFHGVLRKIMKSTNTGMQLTVWLTK